MEEFNEYEYSVEHSKKDRRLRRRKAMLVWLYIGYCLVFLFLVLVVRLLAPLYALVVVSCAFIWFLTWRYVQPTYLYNMTSGTLTFYTIYGGRTKKKIFSTKIADAEFIGPAATGEAKTAAEGCTKSYYGVSEMSSPDAYIMVFRNPDGERCAYYFEATRKAIKILSFYNRSTKIGEVRY